MTRSRVLIFAKAPLPGRVKTRLIPALGTEGAAALAAEMLERTIDEALAAAIGPVELCGDPDPGGPEWAGWLRDEIELATQGEGDLGARMSRAARRTLERGEHALLIGTDCPGLDRHRLRAASERLDRHESVIHPTEDGGYALLGLDRFDPSVFEEIAWSTPAVAAETMARIRKLGWPLHVGETLRDIDEPGDLL